MTKPSSILRFLKITAGAIGLALLMVNSAAAASIEVQPGATPATPPGAAIAKLRADVNKDGVEDSLAERLAGASSGEKFDVIVIFDGPNATSRDAVARARGIAGQFSATREFSVINGFQASLTAGQIQGLSRSKRFHISGNAEVKAFDIPSNYDMGVTNARTEFGFDGTGVTICVIDTGINAAHEQFNSKGPGGGPLGASEFHDAINNQSAPYDDHGHGSHVSGIATGDGNGSTSLADDAIGVAPGASLVVAKVLAADGSGTDAQVLEGIDWCAARSDVDILSMSLGGDPTDGTDPLSVAVNCVADPASSGSCNQAISPKIMVIAAGNAGDLWSTVGTPGVAANAITVGSIAEYSGNPSVNWQDDGIYLNSFSSRGPVVDGTGAAIRIKPDIVAPGSQVLSAYYSSTNANAYAVASGTSMATPFVSGVIALMLEANPDLGIANDGGLPHVKVRNILASTAAERGAPGMDNEYGHGIIDAYSAVAEAAGLTGYVPNAYPGYTRLGGESVADFGNWTHEFTVTTDLVGLPIAGTATINGEFTETCLMWFGPTCWLPGTAWSPDLEVILEREATPGSWSQVAAGAGEVTFSECPARGECGAVGRAEVVHFIPPAGGSYRFRVFPANDDSNQGVGGSFDFEISMGAAAPGTGGNISPIAAFNFACTDLACAFTDASSDPGGSIVSWSWAFGDGATSTAQNLSHTYASAGTYSVTLTVTDDEGASTSVTKSVMAPPAANTPPTANFSFSANDLTANFTDASSDPGGGIASWSWAFGDGATSTAQNPPSHTYASANTYSVTLTVTDDDGATNSTTKSVTVTEPAPNVPPTSSFTVDRNPCGTDFFPNKCQFTDTSTDAGGNVVSWNWDFGGGSASGLPIAPGHSMLVQFPADGPNPVTVTLTVTDNGGAVHSSSMELPISNPVVANDPPTASITAPAGGSTSTVGNLISFNGSANDTKDGNITGSLAWTSSIDGAIGTGASFSTTSLSVGIHAITAAVTDSGGLNGQASITVTVDPINSAPTANFSSSTSELTATFSDGSSDSDGTITSWSWTFGDDGTSTAQNPSHPYAAEGTYTVTLTVTDDKGASSSPVSKSVTVTAPNSAPTANFSAVTSGLTANFTDGSSDTDGTIASRTWNFGDGGLSTAQNPSHTYAAAGTYTVTLTVTDDKVATSSPASKNVTVTAPTSTKAHIGNLDASSTNGGKSWAATVTVTVHAGGTEAAVSNATVSGSWLGASGTISCVTGSTGTCSMSATGIRKNRSSVTFSVSGVIHGSLTYSSSDNHDPDGDSTGTAINVLKP